MQALALQHHHAPNGTQPLLIKPLSPTIQVVQAKIILRPYKLEIQFVRQLSFRPVFSTQDIQGTIACSPKTIRGTLTSPTMEAESLPTEFSGLPDGQDGSFPELMTLIQNRQLSDQYSISEDIGPTSQIIPIHSFFANDRCYHLFIDFFNQINDFFL